MLTAAEKRALSAERVCVFTHAGNLLWRSPAWTDGKASAGEEHRLLGREWLEFVIERDAQTALDWLAATSGPTHLFFCCLPPSDPRPMRCLWVKRPMARGVWLVLGKVVAHRRFCACPHASIPAPPCIICDD